MTWPPGSGYVSWDERIAPESIFKVSYKLSAFTGNFFGDSDQRLGAPSETYRAEVEVRIDGVRSSP